jgi:hypothetical protein
VSSSDTSGRSGGLDLPTLVVTALASATAAYVTSKIWAPGTLAAAAFTPVLVALLKEAYFKPVEVVTRAVPVRGVVRSAPPPGQAEPQETPELIEARIAQLGEAPGASLPGTRRNWQIAVVTGLLGFIIAAVIITVPELVAGSSASGGDRGTTADPVEVPPPSPTPMPEEDETTPPPPAEESPEVPVTPPPPPAPPG